MTGPDQRCRDATGTESTITRRAVVGGLGAVGLGVGLAGSAEGRRPGNSGDPDGSWPSYAGNAANTGWVAGRDGVATAVEERWAVESEPRPNELSVHGGRVYLSLDDGESDPYVGAVRALDAETGEQQWRFETDRWMQSTPVVRGDAVYALANGDGEGYVYELNANDGSKRWSRSFGREVVAALSVVDGTVYVGRIDGGVVALSSEDGDEQWRAITEADVWYPPAVVDGTVYVTGDRGGRGEDPPEVTRIHALDAETGERRWRYEVGEVGAPSPVVAGGTVYVSDYDGGLRALADDGTERWTFDVDDHGGTPTVHDGTVYLAGPTTLYALDAADGSVRWRIDCESDAATPVGTTGALYAVLDGRLTAIDPSTGETRMLGPASGWVTAVVGDTVYLRSDRTVRAVTVTERASGLPTPTPSPSPTSTPSPSPTPTPSPTTTAPSTDPPATAEDDSDASTPGETTSGTGTLGVLPAVGGAVGLGVLGAIRARLRDGGDDGDSPRRPRDGGSS